MLTFFSADVVFTLFSLGNQRNVQFGQGCLNFCVQLHGAAHVGPTKNHY